MWGVYRGLTIILEKSMTHILIETDSEQVVLFIKGDTPPNFAQRALLEDTKFLMHRCNCSISYTPREANKCADGLANLGATHQDNLVVLDDPPSAIVSLLIADMVGASCVRT